MKLEEFNSKLNESLPMLLDEDTFIKILNINNNLYRFDILNRIALNIMYDYELLDVKTEEEWFKHGRKIIDKKKIIYITTPKYGTKYIDNETKEQINVIEFTPSEIQEALRLGVISKINDAEDISINIMYDIKNTSNIDKSKKYDIVKPKIDLKILIELAKEITGMTIEPSDEVTFYSEKDNNLFLAKESYRKMVNKILDILVNLIFKQVENEIEIDKQYKDIIKHSALFSLQTLFNIENKNELIYKLKSNMITDYNIMLDILYTVDIITFKVIEQLEKINGIDNCSSADTIEKNNKISAMLSIMQANSIQIKMKGV